jgi:hypothetical protein
MCLVGPGEVSPSMTAGSLFSVKSSNPVPATPLAGIYHADKLVVPASLIAKQYQLSISPQGPKRPLVVP